MTLARRAILKMIGAVPAALPLASHAAPALLAQAEALAAAGTVLDTGYAVPVSASAAAGEGTVGKIVGKQLSRLKRQLDAEQYFDVRVAGDGIPHDLACIKSTSRSYKIARAKQQLRSDLALELRLISLLWPGSPGG